MDLSHLLSQLSGGLIVSCQAAAGDPLFGPEYIAAMARAAAAGGAAGIRANGPEDIAVIRTVVELPIIGIFKDDLPGYAVRITPTLEHAVRVAMARADIIALDATDRPHPDGLSGVELLRLVQAETGRPVMADVATFAEGVAAAEAGAELVATTLSGYTGDGLPPVEPDFELLHRLAEGLDRPVVAEGRIATPEQAARALELGAFAVVVGSAITRPEWITAQFVERMKR
jgi:N-acylglucosamine-6-phosphate 2-epimerase